MLVLSVAVIEMEFDTELIGRLSLLRGWGFRLAADDGFAPMATTCRRFAAVKNERIDKCSPRLGKQGLISVLNRLT